MWRPSRVIVRPSCRHAIVSWGSGAASAAQMSARSSGLSCLAIISSLIHPNYVSPMRYSLRVSRGPPDVFLRMSNRGAGAAVLAVPPVLVEEHEMIRDAPLHALDDAM